MSDHRDQEVRDARGPLAWMTKNSVAANLLMFVLLLGGALSAAMAKQEVFPEFTLNWITITTAYPGASPKEAEEIVTSVEQAVTSIEGVEEVVASAAEGFAGVYVKLYDDADPDRTLGDVKNAVDRITTLPADAEEPSVSLLPNRREVISLVLHGDVPDKALRELAEQARDELKAHPDLSDVELSATRAQQIHIDVPARRLRQFGLSHGAVAAAIRGEAVELPAGAVKTRAGEVLLRTRSKPTKGEHFEDLTVAATPDGGRLSVGDLGEVRDAFIESDFSASYNGEPAVLVRVYRAADQTPIEVADAVKAYVAQRAGALPAGVKIDTWMDQSKIFRERLDLMMRNMAIGFGLVLVILGLFLDTRLAFWVTLGIPISFLGSFLLFPQLDASINMVSMFAFIVTLGIVVDDAIVVGENIYELRQRYRDKGLTAAAIAGVKEVAKPVTFSVLTTVAAFSPMFFVPGVSGKIFGVIPAIVVSVIMMSLVESFFILPAHLSHGPSRRPLWQRMVIWGLALALLGLVFGLLPPTPFAWWLGLLGGAVAGAALPIVLWAVDRVFTFLRRFATKGMYWSINHFYKPILQWTMDNRYLVLAGTLAFTMGTCAQIAGGRMKFTFMPDLESDIVIAQVTLPFGAPASSTQQVHDRLLQAAMDTFDEYGGIDRYAEGLFSQVGTGMPNLGPVNVGGGPMGGHVANVQVYLVGSADRPFTAREFVTRWRDKTGDVPGVDTLLFKDSIGGPSAGLPIDVKLMHSDIEVLEAAAADLAKRLEDYEGVKDIDDGVELGKPQIDFEVTRLGRSLGLTEALVGRQVRDAYYGAEVKRQQRGLDEMKVMVRLPLSERRSLHGLDNLMLRTPSGHEVPFRLAAKTKRGHAYTSIQRADGQRALHVSADLDKTVTNANDVYAALLVGDGEAPPPLVALTDKYPGLSFGFAGERKEQLSSMMALGVGFLMALVVIYALIAIPFGSYLQPVVIMFAIVPAVGAALFGHVLMGFDLSVISVMGIIALAGVVINDSLVMVATANTYRDEGKSAWSAIRDAGLRRFRPIMLTSLTTFGGLAPMIMETSMQARFLIPMAISLGFGILLTLPFIHIAVPAVYLITEDIKRLFGLAPPVKRPPVDDTPDAAELVGDDEFSDHHREPARA